MSQEKVDRYKKEKANREKIQKKEKRTLFLEKLAITVVGIAMVAWIGYSAYGVFTRPDPDAEQEVVTTEMDITAISDYLNGLAEETAE
nr:hypothetical protein [uncultured Blautia sp.]